MAKDALGHGSNGGKGGPTRPIPNSPYHQKASVELRYISQDAREAGRNAQQMGDDKGVNKYADQVADAATVLGYRSRGGLSDHPNDVAARALASGPKSAPVATHDAMVGVGPNSPLAGSRDYDPFGRPRTDKSSYDEYSRDLAYRSRQGNGGIGSGGRR